ncbi:MAG: 2-dehydro-3-deoxygalactonokinase [Ectothiorhodospiraceae bacterium]|nr:2-dehydro-3-deoxygalactonokinase [Ectothiorhodospiraceae bacterium]
MSTALVGLDWGTSSLRAYRIDADGAVLERRESPRGILAVADGDFEGALRALVGDWLRPELPVLASGMIGSRQGWVEVPYIGCPTDLSTLAGGLATLTLADGVSVRFVPGLLTHGDDGIPDVMRGEETQIIGACAGAEGDDEVLLVLPGTHSKWALGRGDAIDWFATFMTGELFAVLRQHSILGRLMTTETFDAAAFDRGVDYGLDRATSRGGLLKRLFSARTLGLAGDLDGGAVHAYLSGLLLGAEVGEALAIRPADSVLVVGSSTLTERYMRALARAGVRAMPGPSDVVARGQLLVARAAGMVEI